MSPDECVHGSLAHTRGDWVLWDGTDIDNKREVAVLPEGTLVLVVSVIRRKRTAFVVCRDMIGFINVTGLTRVTL